MNNNNNNNITLHSLINPLNALEHMLPITYPILQTAYQDYHQKQLYKELEYFLSQSDHQTKLNHYTNLCLEVTLLFGRIDVKKHGTPYEYQADKNTEKIICFRYNEDYLNVQTRIQKATINWFPILGLKSRSY